MKKFLSLVLTLVMAMSLVTISAGATEYKDLTDKDEIQYEEAVAVLNRLGIITGYSDGSFRPTGELTRGAAAKIIVSLMIGPEAAENLTVNSAPYSDVPVDSTFAAVINYCKTAGFISGYGDGTFRPSGKLTGYAFSKMLLGALGYKSAYEGFEGAGWNMNVAAIGNEAHLFDRVSFKGNEKITRDVACQLALNTLKATMVEYSGGMNVTNGDQSVVVNPTRSYKFSNQEFARHINNKKAANTNNVADDVYTVEFGEEHFVDLRMDHDRTTNDAFGRPANEWSYKKVTIGTFPIEPDYVFTAQTSHLDATDAAKNRATGLGSLKLDDGDATPEYTNFWLNGEKIELATNGKWDATGTAAFGFDNGADAKVADISDLTDNGAIVEVYVDDDVANWIRDVVVIKTQLMEVRRTGSDYVALQAYDNGEPDNKTVGSPSNGFNQAAINESVNNIQVEDEAYAVVKDLKVGDLVAVVPVATDESGDEFDVAEAYVPEEVKGALSAAETYSTKLNNEKKTVNVTVGGTKYNVAQWSKDLVDIDGDAVKVTRKDVTLYLDNMGNAMLAKDVGSTEDFIIIGSFTRTMVDNRIVTIANGWDISGEPLELNLGASTTAGAGYAPGDVAYYTNASANHADWALSRQGGTSAKSENTGGLKYVVGEVSTDDGYEIKSSNVQVKVDTYGNTPADLDNFLYTDKSVKFVFVNFNTDGEVDSVEVKTGVQNVKLDELKNDGNGVSNHSAQVAVKEDTIKAVIIKGESNDATASNLMYIRERNGGFEKDADGNMIYKYTVVMMRPNEKVDEEVVIYSDDNVREDTFVAYTAKEHAQYSNFYDLRDHSSLVNRTTGTYQAELASIIGQNGSLLVLGNYKYVLGDNKALTGNETALTPAVPEVQINDAPGAINTNGGVKNIVRIRNAEIVDLRYDAKTAARDDREINSIDDLVWFFENKLNVDNTGTPVDTDSTNYYLGDTAGAKTLQMQLVVNDNPSSDYFREVALIVITDVYAANSTNVAELQSPASTDASLQLQIGDSGIIRWTDNGDGTYSATVDYDTADVGDTPNVVGTADEDATVTIEAATTATNTVTFANGAGTGTITLADGVTLVIKVAAEDGTTEKTYTVTLNEVDSSVFNYSTVPADAVTANSNLEDQSLTSIDDLIVYDDGTDATLLNQVKEALIFLGYEEDSIVVEKDGAKVNWQAKRAGATLNSTGAYTPDIDVIEVEVSGNKVYVDVSSSAVNINTGLTGITIGNVKEVKADANHTVVYHAGAKNTLTNAADNLNAGSVYTDAAFRVFDDTNVDATGFDVTYSVNDQAVTMTDGSTVVEVGTEVTVTLTATADVTLAATPKTNAAKITLGNAGNVVLGSTNTVAVAGVVASNASGVLTFKNDASLPIIATGDTFSMKLAAVTAPAAASDVWDPTIEYAEAQ